MEAYWGSGGIAALILNLGTSGGEWSASRPGRFTPKERAPDTHWTGGWVGHRYWNIFLDFPFTDAQREFITGGHIFLSDRMFHLSDMEDDGDGRPQSVIII
jgi:hypothetical protein